ncbi:PAS domain S-box protein [Aurantimonas aggregata]|uniref:PAS domain S-box protein n=1 Tax=Aurantimonas aggregata TaxID=2047720 RepID=A0A6L9MJI0_9HYPH|nr:sigma 54-interacting transcriptional regulator [Aurantimonas aggregata]NDV87630.1 PAS domain S-box protein [Aurantimonas aggregata]
MDIVVPLRPRSLAHLIVDPSSDRVVSANAAAARLLGTDEAQLAGARLSNLHPGQLAALIVFCDAVITLGSYWTRSLLPRHGEGADLEIEVRGEILERTDREALLLFTLIDLKEQTRHAVDAAANRFQNAGIAEWQRVDRIFRDIERENQLILRAAGEGIYGVNAEGKTTFLNPAAETLLGWRAEELVGRSMHQCVHHHHADGTPYRDEDCPIYAAFRDGAVHTVSDEVFWRKDGSSFLVEYTSTPIREQGVVVGAVTVFRDVTRRRRAEEELRQALAENDMLRQRLERENAYLQEEIRLEFRDHGIVGKSPAVEAIRQRIELVAPSDAAVLVTGQSGTGKELIARAIHEASGRGERPLIRTNCAAVPRELFESEFFGHARGAFTGALRDRVGRFELADGGTLFLDEVGEIPLELQSKLLRILQEGQFERIGEERTRHVDVRIVAATNRDLEKDVAAGRFRADLFFRLNVFPIHAAPLRDRVEDIPLLVAHFLDNPARKGGRQQLAIRAGDMARLQAYDWPGNVRELQNVLERAVILSRDGMLTIDLPNARPATREDVRDGDGTNHDIRGEAARRAQERADIEAALRRAGGKVSGPGGAAELLDLKPTTLASRIKALGLKPWTYRG